MPLRKASSDGDKADKTAQSSVSERKSQNASSKKGSASKSVGVDDNSPVRPRLSSQTSSSGGRPVRGEVGVV